MDAEPQPAGESGPWRFEPRREVDHYRILRPLGRGGMAEVYLARDIRLGRKVALKVIRRGALADGEAVARFLFEARTTARFSHPHIVAIHDVGEVGGSPYVALEYLEGRTLRELLRDERPGTRETIRIGLAIAQALHEAHGRGVLHRDLKPENVMLPADGRLRVLDFGLARSLGSTPPPPPSDGAHPDEERPAPQVGRSAPTWAIRTEASDATGSVAEPFRTAGKSLMGTPAYMAPEQWEEATVDPAADVWALGIILYELCAGQRPYPEEGLLALCRRVLGGRPVPPVTAHGPLPDSLATLIHRCLEKDPGQRPTAGEVASELEVMLGRRPAQDPDEPPFRGLLPFGEAHQHLFFGRETEIASFLEQLRRQPLVAVAGPSGAGKSSFVQAGVIPRLRERGPLVVVSVRPGRKPLQSLAASIDAAWRRHTDSTGGRAVFGTPTEWGRATAQPTPSPEPAPGPASVATALSEAPSRLNLLLHDLAERHQASVVLFVDQLEELYAVAEDPSDRRIFTEALGSAADDPEAPVRVVLTIREEFLGRLAEGPGGKAALRQIIVLRAPGAAALRETLRRPVEARGYRFEDPELENDMVKEVAGESAALPLLQFAAQSLWEQRDPRDHVLRREAYETMGGVAGSLARHADGVLASLTPFQIDIVRGLLLRLVTTEGTRRALPRTQLLEGLGAEAVTILDGLLDARLCTARRPPGGSAIEIEIVHESLVTRWGQLRRWLDESREDLAFLEEVGQASAIWERRGSPEDEVWHSDALRSAQRAIAGLPSGVPAAVHRFLAAGERRERRRIRQKRVRLVAAIAGLAVIAVVASVVAWILSRQKQEVVHQRAVAIRRRAESQREGARAALARGDLLAARAMLRSALESGDSMAARVLWWRLSEMPLLWRRNAGGRISASAFSIDGRELVLAGDDGTVKLLDPRTRAVLRVLRAPLDSLNALALSPDGAHLAAAARSGATYLWSLRTGTLVARSRAASRRLAVAFSPDGRFVADGGGGRDLRVWRVSDRRVVARMPARGYQIWTLAFSPDGTRLAAGGTDRTIRIWSFPTGSLRRTLRGHTKPLAKITFSADGRRLLASDLAWRMRLWDLGTGRTVWEVAGRGGAFHPQGKVIAMVRRGRLRRVHFVEARSGTVLSRSLRSACSWLDDVSFSPDGGLLAGTGGGPCVQLWDLSLRERSPPTGGHRIRANAARFAPGGDRVVSAGLDGTVRLWDVGSGREVAVLRAHARSALRAVFSPDGRWLASGGSDGVVRLWNTTTWEPHRVLLGHGLYAGNVAFRPDGRLLASTGEDAAVRLWEVPSGRPRGVLRARGAIIVGFSEVDFQPGGHLVAVGSRDGAIRIFDTRTGSLARTLRGHRGEALAVAFRPDGKLLASGGYDRTLRLWDLARGTARVLRSTEIPRVSRLAFHPDGRRLGVASPDGPAFLFDLGGGRAPQRLDATPTGDPQGCQGIAFSRQGRRAVTASGDGTIRLWETGTGRPAWRAPALLWVRGRATLLSHRGWEPLVAWSGDATTRRDRPQHAWARAVALRAAEVDSDPGSPLLCVKRFDGTLAVWDRSGDRLLREVTLPNVARPLALPSGCLALSRAGTLSRFWPLPARAFAWAKVSAVGRDAHGLLVVAGGDVIAVPEGVLLGSPAAQGRRVVAARTYWRSVGDASAVARAPGAREMLIVGFRDGSLRAIDVRAAGASTYLEDTPPSAVTHLLPGPGGLLFAGFAGGAVGIWDLHGGARLHLEVLHGRVRFLVLRRNLLYAASDLGDQLVWDLHPLYRPAAALLRDVRRKVPVVWRDGRAIFADSH